MHPGESFALMQPYNLQSHILCVWNAPSIGCRLLLFLLLISWHDYKLVYFYLYWQDYSDLDKWWFRSNSATAPIFFNAELRKKGRIGRNKGREKEKKWNYINYTETAKSSVSQEEHTVLTQHCGYHSSSFFCLFLIKPSFTLPSHYHSGRFLTEVSINNNKKKLNRDIIISLTLCACAYMQPPPTGKWTALTGKCCASALLNKVVDDTLAVSWYSAKGK